MIFGKIDYINLLPLHIYLKKYPLPNGFKAVIAYKKGVPSKLNEDLFFRRIDAGIISSVKSGVKKYQNLDLGICACRRVQSVIVRKNAKTNKDKASASSNALAKILKVKGEVIIGDRALKAFLASPNEYKDLCELWYQKTNLPFVFGRFSCTKKKQIFKHILYPFLRQKIFIPDYILEHYAKTRELDKKDIRSYLKLIYYELKFKEKRALKLFLQKAKQIRT